MPNDLHLWKEHAEFFFGIFFPSTSVVYIQPVIPNFYSYREVLNLESREIQG